MEKENIKNIKNPLKRGDAYMEAKEYTSALDSYLEALMTDTGNVSINAKMGEAYLKLGNYKEAKQIFEEILRINPSSFIARNYIEKLNPALVIKSADECFARKEFDEAEEKYKNGLQLEPKNIHGLYGLAKVYIEKDEGEKAIKIYETISNMDEIYNSEFKHILNHVAIGLRKSGNIQKAISLYNKAIEIDPNDEGLNYNLSRAFWVNGDKEKAIEEVNKALEKDDSFEEARNLLEQYKSRL